MKGCIQGLVVNGERIGLWNFISYNGPKPGQSCQNKYVLKIFHYHYSNIELKIAGHQTTLRQMTCGDSEGEIVMCELLTLALLLQTLPDAE